MLSTLKRLGGRVLAPAVPDPPWLREFAARGKRWNPASVRAPWFERRNALRHAGGVARRHGLGEQGEHWLRHWVEQGYFVVKGAVDPEAARRYADEFEQVWWMDAPVPGLTLSDVTIAGEYHVHISHDKLLSYGVEQRREAHGQSNWRVGEFYQSSKAAEAIYRDARLAKISSAILDTLAVPHFSLSFSKGSRQGLHQDICVFHVWPRNALIGVWIAAEDISPASGPLEYYPGSHREPIFEAFKNYPQTQRRTAPQPLAAKYDEYVRDVAVKYPREVFLAKTGDALFWHGMLIHGGASVEDPATTRKSMVIHYMPEGANRGHEVEGPFNW